MQEWQRRGGMGGEELWMYEGRRYQIFLQALIMFGSGYVLNQIFQSSGMGACLKMFSQPQQPPKPKANSLRPPDSDRRSLSKPPPERQKQPSFSGRSNIEIQSNSSVRQTKIFFKTKSTALFSTDSDRRHSSVLQFTLDHESMIVKATNEGAPAAQPEQYYTLVQKIALVRKTMDCLKVTTPDGQSELHCPPQFLFSTLTVSQGKPADTLQQVAPNKFIQITNSPIKLRIKLRCESCKKQLRTSFCKGVVHLGAIACPACDCRENWSIQDIESNFPIWGGGSKIQNHEKVQPAPNILRAMGCVICLKFTNCENMKCGCLICRPCLNTQEQLALDQECWMCEGSSYIR